MTGRTTHPPARAMRDNPDIDDVAIWKFTRTE